MEVVTRSKKTERSLTVDYDFGADLAEAVKIHGEKVIFDHYVADGKVCVQAMVRGALNDPANTDLGAIKTKFGAWKLGETTARGTGVTVGKVMQKIADDVSALDSIPDDQLDAVQKRVSDALAARKKSARK